MREVAVVEEVVLNDGEVRRGMVKERRGLPCIPCMESMLRGTLSGVVKEGAFWQSLIIYRRKKFILSKGTGKLSIKKSQCSVFIKEVSSQDKFWKRTIESKLKAVMTS